MAVLHKKEEKIQAVLGRLPQKYSNEEFVAMFIKLYSKDWGKIKSAYIKQSQDKEPGTVINMPKPDLYLKQILETYLKNNVAVVETKTEPKIVKEKATVKKREVAAEPIAEPKKAKAVVKKKDAIETETAEPKKTKAPAKEKVVKEIVAVKPKKAASAKKI